MTIAHKKNGHTHVKNITAFVAGFFTRVDHFVDTKHNRLKEIANQKFPEN